MLKRWSLLAAAIVIVGAVGTAMVLGIAQQPPPLPQGHIPIAPGTPAATCFECHQSPPPLKTEQIGFCKTCHITTHFVLKAGFDVQRPGPRPKHVIAFDWTAGECNSCHTPHKTKVAKHPVNEKQPNSSFCIPCHETPTSKGITGQENAGEFCAGCHNLGLAPTHVQAPPDAKANFCFGCHK
jgi:predicted CXXCH cytochrome family protein